VCDWPIGDTTDPAYAGCYSDYCAYPKKAADETNSSRLTAGQRARMYARLNRKVDRSAGPDGCWPCMTRGMSGRYVSVWTGVGVRVMGAHRAAWEQASGAEVPSGKVVLHSCDNPPCCNPRHLRLGTKKENSLDMARKGRQIFQKCPDRIQRGEAHGRARLSASAVRDLRRRHGNGEEIAAMAEEFGVARSTAQHAIDHRTMLIRFSPNAPTGRR
jgi:hypothetical protein